MLKLQDKQIFEARRMREAGHSWRHIGRIFGVKEDTVMAAVDPIYAERRRQQLRDSRARNGRAKAAWVKPVKHQPIAKREGEVWSLQSEVGRGLGLKAVTIRMISPSYACGLQSYKAMVPVSLPYIPSLYKGQLERPGE